MKRDKRDNTDNGLEAFRLTVTKPAEGGYVPPDYALVYYYSRLDGTVFLHPEIGYNPARDPESAAEELFWIACHDGVNWVRKEWGGVDRFYYPVAFLKSCWPKSAVNLDRIERQLLAERDHFNRSN